jgi:hypothetical protein
MVGAESVVRYRDNPNHADHIIEPGDRRASELFLRITEQKEYLRMPPIGSLGSIRWPSSSSASGSTPVLDDLAGAA